MPALSMTTHRACLNYRVPYADTDQMGVVYYANYLVYFERARGQLLRDLDLPYSELEKRGFALPVIEANVQYKSTASYEDELDIGGWFAWVKGARLRIDCEVCCDGKLLAQGHTVHAVVDRQTLKPVRAPDFLRHLCPPEGDSA